MSEGVEETGQLTFDATEQVFFVENRLNYSLERCGLINMYVSCITVMVFVFVFNLFIFYE